MINVKKGSTATVMTISDERVCKYFQASIETQRIIQEFRMLEELERTLLLLRTAGEITVTDEVRRYVCREYLDRYQAVSLIQLSNLADWLRLMVILRTLEQIPDAEQSRLKELISHPDLSSYFFNT